MSVKRHNFARTSIRRIITRKQTNLVSDANSGTGSLAPEISRLQLEKKVLSLESALAKANRFAHYDELTGLPNRRLLLDRFIQAASLANRHRQQLALLFFDLNNFKSVNDQLGHTAGDRLLQQVATRLLSSIRASDTVCRYGGDEFVVLLTEITGHDQVVKVIEKVRAGLAPPYVLDRFSIRVTVSSGLAIYPDDAQSFSDLLRIADHVMFGNKPGNQGQAGDASSSNAWFHAEGCHFAAS